MELDSLFILAQEYKGNINCFIFGYSSVTCELFLNTSS